MAKFILLFCTDKRSSSRFPMRPACVLMATTGDKPSSGKKVASHAGEQTANGITNAKVWITESRNSSAYEETARPPESSFPPGPKIAVHNHGTCVPSSLNVAKGACGGTSR